MTTELERLLSFNNLNPRPSRSTRDSQRQKLYDAERQAFGDGMLYHRIQECQTVVDVICKSRFWKSLLRRNGKHWLLEERLHCAPVKRGGHTACWNENDLFIHLPKTSFTKWVILHELAHAATTNKTAAHGPEFARTYLQLVKRFMGQRAYQRLLAEFRNGKIRRSRRTTKKSRFVKGSPEAREYMAGLRAARKEKK